MDDTITCYDYGGQAFPGNVKCPDSDSCCETTAQCRSDRLCTSNNSTAVLVRATCEDIPWSLQACAQICLYSARIESMNGKNRTDTSEDSTTGYLPRVNICENGSYCCDDNPECCEENDGVYLSSDGVAIALANQTTISSSASSTATVSSSASSAATVSSSTTQLSSTQTSSSNSTSGSSSGWKIGVGVGVPLGLLALCAVAFALIYFNRYKRNKPKGSDIGSDIPLTQAQPVGLAKPVEVWTEPAELPAK